MPIGGSGIVTGGGEVARVAWRLSGRAVDIVVDYADVEESHGASPVLTTMTSFALADGSLLADFTAPPVSSQYFSARVSEGSFHVEFERHSTPPARPDGTDSVIPIVQGPPSFAFRDGYVKHLRSVPGSMTRQISAANFRGGVERFLDWESFSEYTPFSNRENRSQVIATNNANELVAARFEVSDSSYHALFHLSRHDEWSFIACAHCPVTSGVFSGPVHVDPTVLTRDITADGDFVFAVPNYDFFSWACIVWSVDSGHRLLSIAGDRLTIPGDDPAKSRVIARHIGHNAGSTLIFTHALLNDTPDIQYKIAIVRQHVSSSYPLADLNRDGIVDLLDLNILLDAMSKPVGSPESIAGDIDFNQRTDMNDLQILLRQWGQR